MSSNTKPSESSVIENFLRDARGDDATILPILSKGCLLNYPFNISCMTRIVPYSANLTNESFIHLVNALNKSNHNHRDLLNGYARETIHTAIIPRDIMTFIANTFCTPACISELRNKALSIITTCATSNRNDEDFQYWTDHGLIDVLKATEEKSQSLHTKSNIAVVLCNIAKHCNCPQLRDGILNKTLYQCMKAIRLGINCRDEHILRR
eukprot:836931_1